MAERFRIIPQEDRVREILADNEVFLDNDHFVYTKGDHGSQYLNKDAIFPNTKAISELSKFIAREFMGKNVDTVAGPALGGIIVSQRVAEHLSDLDFSDVNSVFAEKVVEKVAEKEEEKLVFKRGYEKFIKDKNVLAVEDILNTGGSAKELIDLIRNTGGNVIGLGALANRGGVKPEDVGVLNIKSLLDIEMERFPADDCHLCKEGVPINLKIGHGSRF